MIASAPLLLLASSPLSAPATDRSDIARSAAVHPVANIASMQRWLARVPVTRDFPPDLGTVLSGAGPAFTLEMSSTGSCIPCDDLWSKLQSLGRRHGIAVRVIAGNEAAIKAGRLALPWVGYPVAWLRPKGDESRSLPIAIGTDHAANLTRNIYLAIKMQTGVRAAVGVRALSKFTGIVGASPARTHHNGEH